MKQLDTSFLDDIDVPKNENKLDTSFLEESPKIDEIGEAEALIRGLAEGASMGFAGEIEGAGKAIGQTIFGPEELANLVDTYRKERDIAEAKHRQAAEENPVLYGGAELVGGIAPAIGTGGAGAVSALGKGALKEAAKLGAISGAKYGAVQGLGKSKADIAGGEILPAIGETAKESLLGAGVGAGFGTIGAGLTKAAITGKEKLLDTASGQIEKAIDSYKYSRQMPQDLLGRTAHDRLQAESKDLAKKAIDSVNTVKNIKTQELTELLNVPTKIDISDDLNLYKNELNNLLQKKDANTRQNAEMVINNILDFESRFGNNPVIVNLQEANDFRKKLENLNRAIGKQNLGKEASIPTSQLSVQLKDRIIQALNGVDETLGSKFDDSLSTLSKIHNMEKLIGVKPFTSKNPVDLLKGETRINTILQKGQGYEPTIAQQGSMTNFGKQLDEILTNKNLEQAKQLGHDIITPEQLYKTQQDISKKIAINEEGAKASGLMGIGGLLTGTSGATGIKIGATLGDTMRYLVDIPAQKMVEIANRIKDKHPKVYNLLQKVSQIEDGKKKSALLFSAMQNPSTREALQSMIGTKDNTQTNEPTE